jgi:metal-responsive CopG/Arc/MetJ family transcriptional regulator
MNNPETHSILSTRVPRDLANEIDRAAQASRISRSRFLRRAAEDAVARTARTHPRRKP